MRPPFTLLLRLHTICVLCAPTVYRSSNSVPCYATGHSVFAIFFSSTFAQGLYNDCPEGTSTPLACPAGSYMNTTGYSYCFDCPAGFFCVSGEVDPLRCPRGRYCPGNTTADQPPCPTGTYNPDYGRMNFPSIFWKLLKSIYLSSIKTCY